MARLVLPSRVELKRPEGSSSEAPLAKVSFTTLLYVSPVQMIPACDHTGPPFTERRRAGRRAGQTGGRSEGQIPIVPSTSFGVANADRENRKERRTVCRMDFPVRPLSQFPASMVPS